MRDDTEARIRSSIVAAGGLARDLPVLTAKNLKRIDPSLTEEEVKELLAKHQGLAAEYARMVELEDFVSK